MTIHQHQEIIDFAGVSVPVTWNNQMELVVAMKPVCEAFGLNWKGQRKKMSGCINIDLYGVSLETVYFDYQRRTAVCMPIDKVRPFINRINTARVSSSGNVEHAQKILKLQRKWDIAIARYKDRLFSTTPNRASMFIGIPFEQVG